MADQRIATSVKVYKGRGGSGMDELTSILDDGDNDHLRDPLHPKSLPDRLSTGAPMLRAVAQIVDHKPSI